MPPVEVALLPATLLARFHGTPAEVMLRLPRFLLPLTGATPVTLREGR